VASIVNSACVHLQQLLDPITSKFGALPMIFAPS